MSYEQRFSISSCQCVRDWSGILCEFWGRFLGTGTDLFGNEFGERDGNITSKDIAESPTAIAGTPKIQFIIHNA